MDECSPKLKCYEETSHLCYLRWKVLTQYEFLKTSIGNRWSKNEWEEFNQGTVYQYVHSLGELHGMVDLISPQGKEYGVERGSVSLCLKTMGSRSYQNGYRTVVPVDVAMVWGKGLGTMSLGTVI